MKRYALLSFFDDEPELIRKCLTSIIPHVDEIIALDGRYKNFGSSKNRSSHETLMVFEDLGVEWFDGGIFETQAEKRQTLIEMCNFPCKILCIDADEELLSIDWTVLDDRIQAGLELDGKIYTRMHNLEEPYRYETHFSGEYKGRFAAIGDSSSFLPVGAKGKHNQRTNETRKKRKEEYYRNRKSWGER